MKKIIGIILATVFSCLMFGATVRYYGWEDTLIVVSITVVLFLLLFLISWLLNDEDND